jgi:hypothetical protein
MSTKSEKLEIEHYIPNTRNFINSQEALLSKMASYVQSVPILFQRTVLNTEMQSAIPGGWREPEDFSEEKKKERRSMMIWGYGLMWMNMDIFSLIRKHPTLNHKFSESEIFGELKDMFGFYRKMVLSGGEGNRVRVNAHRLRAEKCTYEDQKISLMNQMADTILGEQNRSSLRNVSGCSFSFIGERKF